MRPLGLVAVALACVTGTYVQLAVGAPPAKPGSIAAKAKGLGETLTGQAKLDYEAGKLLFTDGDYAGALIKFQAAFDATKDPRLLWNLAACEKSLRHYARAIGLLEQYKADATGLVTEKDKADATELVKTLEPFTVVLTIEVSEPDAEIEIDDRSIGKSPLSAPVIVDLGQRKIRAKKDGYRDAVRTEILGGTPKHTIALKLEREVHEGKLVIQAPLGAAVTIDGAEIGQGKGGAAAIETTLESGGHTLRVRAPGMRLYEREIVVKEGETRAVEVLLEPEGETTRPMLRVAVACIDPTPRNATDLSVYLDGSPTATTAAGGKQTFDEGRGENVIEYVSFPVSSGEHRVVVRVAGCNPSEAIVRVEPGRGAELRGTLEPDSWFARGAASSPDFWRVALAFWMPRSIEELQRASRSFTEFAQYEATGFGGAARGGLALRWITAGVEAAFAGGKAVYVPGADGRGADKLGVPARSAFFWWRVAPYIGGRVPFHFVALSAGIFAGYDSRTLYAEPRPESGFQQQRAPSIGVGGPWVALDSHVLCDLALTARGDVSLPLDNLDAEARGVSLSFGVALQPSAKCRRDRATKFGLTSSGR